MSKDKSAGEATADLMRDMQTMLGVAMQLMRNVTSKLHQLEEAATAAVMEQALDEAQRPAMVSGQIPEVEDADRDGEGGHVIENP